jgi:hypothetical protein
MRKHAQARHLDTQTLSDMLLEGSLFGYRMIKNVPDLDCFTPKHEYRGVRVFDAPTSNLLYMYLTPVRHHDDVLSACSMPFIH